MITWVGLASNCYSAINAYIEHLSVGHYKIMINISGQGPRTFILEVYLPHGTHLKEATPPPINSNKFGTIKWILSSSNRKNIIVSITLNKESNIKSLLKYRDPSTKRIITIYLK